MTIRRYSIRLWPNDRSVVDVTTERYAASARQAARAAVRLSEVGSEGARVICEGGQVWQSFKLTKNGRLLEQGRYSTR